MGWFSELFGEPLGAIGGMNLEQLNAAMQQHHHVSDASTLARMAQQAEAFIEWERRIASYGTDELREAHDRMAEAARQG